MNKYSEELINFIEKLKESNKAIVVEEDKKALGIFYQKLSEYRILNVYFKFFYFIY